MGEKRDVSYAKEFQIIYVLLHLQIIPLFLGVPLGNFLPKRTVWKGGKITFQCRKLAKTRPQPGDQGQHNSRQSC